MSGTEELRQRVLDAEEHFGLINEQYARYSERLIGLMNGVEERIRDRQDEIEQHKSAIDRHRAEIETQKAKIDGQGTTIAQQAGEIEKFKAAAARKAEENEQLCTMLHSLLRAIEAGSRDVLAEVMVQLDSKVSVLIGDGAPEAVAEPEEPAEIAAEVEEPAEIAAEVGEPAETAAAAPEPVAETAALGSLDEIMERVSKLVQETEAAIAAPELRAAEPAEAPEEPAGETIEETARWASAAAS